MKDSKIVEIKLMIHCVNSIERTEFTSISEIQKYLRKYKRNLVKEKISKICQLGFEFIDGSLSHLIRISVILMFIDVLSMFIYFIFKFFW